jgi:hypothetical protein
MFSAAGLLFQVVTLCILAASSLLYKNPISTATILYMLLSLVAQLLPIMITLPLGLAFYAVAFLSTCIARIILAGIRALAYVCG